MVAKIINISRQIRKAFTKSISVNNNPQIEVIATTIITIGDTIPALTAASPKTRAPTILIAAPIGDGIRMLLSRKISKVIIIIITSKAVGKGTPSCWIAKDINNSLGIISWLKVVTAI